MDGVCALLGSTAAAAMNRGHLVAAQTTLHGLPAPAAELIRLFQFAEPVPSARVAQALPRLGVNGLIDLGLVDTHADDVHARCDLRPYAADGQDLWVASDLTPAAGTGGLAADSVVGIGPASLTLASWTPRPSVARALDIGTGCGVQALHLRTHAASVVATDISRRALAYAAFTAALNDCDWDLRQGDLLAPVSGERFDLIVANPPYVMSPTRRPGPRYVYRDAGRPGDAVMAELIAGAQAALTPGGMACLIGNWIVPRGADWSQRCRQWLEPTGLDAWIVGRDLADPAQYAETWVDDLGLTPAQPSYQEWMSAWLADFQTREIDAVAFGIVVLARPTSPRAPWREFTFAEGPHAHPMGPSTLARVRAATWLADHSTADLLDTAWTMGSDVVLEQRSRPWSGDWRSAKVVRSGGLPAAVDLDAVMTGFVGVCDGELSAGRALTAIAAVLDEDAAALTASAVPVLRELVRQGFLAPAGAG